MTATIQPLEQAGPSAYVPVGSWMPTRYTMSLTRCEDFRTDGDRLVRFGQRYITVPDVAHHVLDPWQAWLIRHVLERYPDDWPVVHLRGQLRFRQVVISMGRQNGKSLLGVYFALYLLCLHMRGPRVIGVASVDRQARIIYDRVVYAIENNTDLNRDLRATGTRGIWRRDKSGLYLTLPAREDSAQGEPASGVLADELHLMLAALWDAMVLAQKSKTNAIMIGFTTAGDDESDLLIRLYREGEAAIAGADERFGFFLWEADSDELTEDGVIAANPAVACGRISLDQTMHDATKMWNDLRKGKDGLTGRQRCIRYTLNRQIGGSAQSWTNATAWNGAAVESIDHDGADIVWSLDRTEGWEWANITATTRHGDRYRQELAASIPTPTPDGLFDACKALASLGRCTFALDARTLGQVGKRLREAGYEVWMLTERELVDASQQAHSLITRHAVDHADDPLVRVQTAHGRRRDPGDTGWRLSRGLSTGDVDTTFATVLGLYVAANSTDDHGLQLF